MMKTINGVMNGVTWWKRNDEIQISLFMVSDGDFLAELEKEKSLLGLTVHSDTL